MSRALGVMGKIIGDELKEVEEKGGQKVRPCRPIKTWPFFLSEKGDLWRVLIRGMV